MSSGGRMAPASRHAIDGQRTVIVAVEALSDGSSSLEVELTVAVLSIRRAGPTSPPVRSPRASRGRPSRSGSARGRVVEPERAGLRPRVVADGDQPLGEAARRDDALRVVGARDLDLDRSDRRSIVAVVCGWLRLQVARAAADDPELRVEAADRERRRRRDRHVDGEAPAAPASSSLRRTRASPPANWTPGAIAIWPGPHGSSIVCCVGAEHLRHRHRRRQHERMPGRRANADAEDLGPGRARWRRCAASCCHVSVADLGGSRARARRPASRSPGRPGRCGTSRRS